MKKLVILTLTQGSLSEGFAVTLRLKEDSHTIEQETQVLGYLPPAPELTTLFSQWQSAYHQLVQQYSRMKAKPAQVTNLSCRQLGVRLSSDFNSWLNAATSDWQKIRDRLQQSLSQSDEILVIVQTNDIQVRQLPWHSWDLFSQRYSKAEVVLSTPEYQSPVESAVPLFGQVKVLAILGDSSGIDVQQDRTVLEQLPNAATTFLVEPQRQQLNNQLWEQQWDILFFAGHSSSQADGSSGQIYINQTDSLSLTQLKNALTKAIARGLQIAIFNSCDGLGLAQELACLHIPQVIVMREPVPDKVAQEFLKYFLQAFASGAPFHLAVREARERLQGLEDQYPCATWMPVICQNPASVLLSWQQLCGAVKRNSAINSGKAKNRPTLPSVRRLPTVMLLSVIVTSLVMGARHLGVLQTWELQAFDQLMRLRPEEKPDPRILIVTVTEADIKAQDPEQRRGSLSDAALDQLLQKLEQFKPRAIGLDIYRDFPVQGGRIDLANRLRQNERLVAVCKSSDAGTGDAGVEPPPEIPIERLGFSDFVVDPDGVVRRHLLGFTPEPTSPCSTPYAFSVQMAFQYLVAQGIFPKYTPEGFLQLGTTVFKPLDNRSGAYQRVNTWGHQVLLNYRYTDSPQNVALRVTLSEVLSGRVNPNLVKDRIILIGTTANSFQDFWSTPYSYAQWSAEEMPGVILQAQMVSQILSSVLEHRPLLWWWTQWGDALWIWGWALVGGLVAWRIQHLVHLGLAAVCLLNVLFGLCFVLLLEGGWVPLVPSALALTVTGGCMMAYTVSQTKQQ